MIPQKHQDFIEKAAAMLKRDVRIVGIALGGSYITGAIDEFSDLDFVVAVNPAKMAEVMAERVHIVSQLGELLCCFTGEHVGVPSLMICLYDAPLLHVDFNFVTPEQKANRIEDPVILYEKENALSAVLKSTKPITPQSNLQWCEDHFWVWVHYIAAKIGRGELFDALGSINYIRENVLGPLIQAEKGIFPRGVRFLERDAPEYLPQLIETVPTHDRSSCIRALNAEIELYRALRASFSESILLRTKAELKAAAYLSEI